MRYVFKIGDVKNERQPVKRRRFDEEILPELLGAVPLCLIPGVEELVPIVLTLS